MKWFRFYSEVLHDSKVQTLSPELFRAWVNLLCLANEGTDRGRLPELKQIAFALRVKDEKAAQLVGQLTACGLIDADEQSGNRPHNWDKRQRDSDDVKTRVREHRKRKATVSKPDDVTLHVTEAKRDGNALEERRGEEIRSDSEQHPLPPASGGAVVAAVEGDRASLSQGASEAIESARARHGDKVAAFVAKHAKVIGEHLGGRFDLFLEALDAASLQDPPINQVLPWCIARAKSRARNPPAVVNGHSKASERSRRQQDAFEKALADLPEDH